MKKGDELPILVVMVVVVAMVVGVIIFVKYPGMANTQKTNYLGYESADGWVEGKRSCGCMILQTRCTVKFLCKLRDNYEKQDNWNVVYRELPNNLWKFSRDLEKTSMEKTLGGYESITTGECTTKRSFSYLLKHFTS